MQKHTEIRRVVLDALKSHIKGAAFHDGRPVFLDEKELPAVAVYLTEAQHTGAYTDADSWQAVLHIEVFLRASNPDSALDAWMEKNIYPALASVPGLASLIETMTPQGYDYQRDDEMATWGSADLTYLLTYFM
ncbi:phage minor tail U family protein [Serratia ureilytica]|uniref:phage minor tail U family protein n=1 Tax=Serratia ureilytica TaxID=300181 RepID=UPI00371F4524